ncbi:MAG: glycerol-3-phosphate acyltransferase [Ruminococcaceae bacterium]|nr:glycerol-3-phosphate acyltransferase [Oscillospiraceae bacterium]
MIVLKLTLAALFGYLIGGINPSYIVGRLRGFDIRQKGSGNAGASNAVIVMGKVVGISSALLDILKAAGVVWLAPVIFRGTPMVAEVAGVSCIFGHVFPVYMRFRGGKGLACLGGVLLAVDFRLLLILLAIEILLILLFDYICVCPLTASVIIPFLYGILGDGGFGFLLNASGGWWGAGIIAIGCILVFCKHIGNLRRIKNGTELHLSYLWKKDKDEELARVQENMKK